MKFYRVYEDHGYDGEITLGYFQKLSSVAIAKSVAIEKEHKHNQAYTPPNSILWRNQHYINEVLQVEELTFQDE